MIVSFQGFSVDLQRGRLLRAGQDVPLRPKSFEVLAYLARHAGRVVSKDEIIAEVWKAVAVSDDSLNQCVRDIRRALGSAETSVRTVRGRGYLFETAADEMAVRTIAVLPFLHVVAKHQDEALAFGLADSLIYRLSGFRELIVRPLSSVRRFADPDRDPLAAGRELEVDSVLDGTIQVTSDRLRVGVRLLRVADGSSLWSEQLGESATDALAVQDAIISRLIAALGVDPSPEERRRLQAGETDSPAAFSTQLIAQFELSRRTKDSLEAALAAYEQAVALDPAYARAYAGMADLLAVLQVFGIEPPHLLATRARAAAERALELAPELSDTHLAFGMVKLHFDWDYEGARRHFQRAIELRPSNAVARHRYAILLATLGSAREALAEVDLAVALEPRSLPILTSHGIVLFLLGRYEAAGRSLASVLQIEPRYQLAHYWFAQALAAQGRFEEALAEARAADGLAPTAPLWLIGYLQARLGQEEIARRVLRQLEEMAARAYAPALDVASVFAGLEDRAGARHWLELAVRERSRGLDHIAASPIFASYHHDEWFKNLMTSPLLVGQRAI